MHLLDTVPQTQNMGHVSTSWDDYAHASAHEGIPQMELVSPSTTGEANVLFPIKLPEARNALVPNLDINYTNEGGSTWLGNGWDISLSSFSLDTRWGVPRFSISKESEIYLFEGEQLGPVFHRAAEYDRESEREFILRQELDYHKIIRHGTNPKNYWWEVKETNGTVHYYGGKPDTGFSSDHALVAPSGNITEWKITETRDKYQNFISYAYMKTLFEGGRNIYPATIHYNGHGAQAGDYKVEFVLNNGTQRRDVQISARTGMKQSLADLLSEIIISYKDQRIRSYKMEYMEGMFAKTLLQSISEFDQDGDLFYRYTCEYYNDLDQNGQIVAYDNPISWNVPFDDVPIGSLAGSIDGFNNKPTILGGGKSISGGGGLAVTVGPPFNPLTKDYSAGPNSSFTTSKSEGMISLVDMNGDGLPDKLWKQDDGLFFRPNLHSSAEAPRSFGSPVKINNINDFSIANTFAWSVGFEVNLTPGFLTLFHEESTTNITTYLSDFNGDELMDISHNGKVYFNHIDENGAPTFTLTSGDTPSIIYKGEDLGPSIVDPDDQANLERQNPLHDIVRVWSAPYDGIINIEAEIQLIENTSPEALAYTEADGVVYFIQKESQNLLVDLIAPDDFSVKNTNLSSINVLEGDKIYFRINSVSDGLYDEVIWDPIIRYQGADLSIVNADCIPKYQFQASKDFLVTEYTASLMPDTGRVLIMGEFQKPITSDSIFVELSGAVNTIRAFAPSETFDGALSLDSFDVNGSDEILFTIRSRSNVDWPKIIWKPVVEYIAFSDGSDPLGANGEAKISLCPKVHVQAYSGQVSHPEVFIAPTSGILKFQANSSTFLGGSSTDFNMVMKIKGEVDSVAYASNNLIGVDQFVSIIEQEVSQGDSIFIGLYNDIGETQDLYVIQNSTIELNGNIESVTCGNYLYAPQANPTQGIFYRQWGQFAYNPVDDFPFFPMNLEDLPVDTSGVAGDTALVDPDVSNGELEGSNVDSEAKIILLKTDPKKLIWKGADAMIYLDGAQMGSSRFGLKNVSPDTSNPNLGDGISSPNLKTRYAGNGGLGGLGIGPLEGSGGGTFGDTWSAKDIGDMNGDRYPDLIEENKITYTNQKGGMTDQDFEHDWGTHNASSFAWVAGLGRSPANTGARNAGAQAGNGSQKASVRSKQRGKSIMSKSKSAFKSAKSSVGINGSLSNDDDEAEHSFVDINGDGLEDKIWMDGQVALNLGYDFAPAENWGFEGIGAGTSWDTGAGLGVSVSNGSIQGGVSVSKTWNHSELGFIDLNDDALLDQIISIEPMMVRFNTGNGFTDPINWLNEKDFSAAVSIGESANTAFTFCIEFVFFRVCFNPSAYVGEGTSGVHTAFQDINGDGYVDFLRAEGDNSNLDARNSRVGRTNFLKKIIYPTTGSLSLDYDYVGNTYELPFSKWVVTSAKIADGVEGDGADTISRSFSYEDGYYDRHERQFYGFGTVKDRHLDGGQVKREIVSSFDVSSYYSKGLNTAQVIKDGSGNLYKEITKKYFLKDVVSGANLPIDYAKKDDGAAFPALAEVTTSFYEGGSESLSNTMYYSYDTLNMVSSITDIDEAGSTKISFYKYDYDFDNYILDRLISETISSNNVLLRETQYELDALGNPIEMAKRIDASRIALTNMSYDEYGNLNSLTRPANYKGERLKYEYSYDQEAHQYLTSEKNSYGYVMEYQNEYLFNQLIYYKDINGHETTYMHDSKGRVESIRYPFEADSNLPYSVRFEYHPDENVPYASVFHFDTEHETYIALYYFEDGIQRSIQSKTFAMLSDENGNVSEGYIVSGTDKFDGLGRIVESYLPITESTNSPEVFNQNIDGLSPVIKKYDPLDRPIQEIDTYGAVTDFQFGLSEDNLGRPLLSQLITDPLGNESEALFNTRGDLSARRFHASGIDIWTNYEYDDLSQVVSIIDTYGNETSYEYDLLGRRIAVKVPDAGLTTLSYDAADNLTDRVTATIRDVISEDGSIRYSYDHERLIQIDYPKHFENKVQIHYGTAQDSFNRVGRIWLQEDATGGREYFFDLNGNPTKTIRTIMVNRSKVYTYVSENAYDGWGRIQKMQYADGEVVEYDYDRAGMLNAMHGQKGADEFMYLKQVGYDKFKERIYMEYGNGVIDRYQFDNKGRLANRMTNSESQGILSDEYYNYDLADNLIKKENTAQGSEQMGGTSVEHFSYDDLHRMSMAEGTWNREKQHEYLLFFDYDDLSKLTMKGQNHEIDGVTNPSTSRNFDYSYESSEQPTRPSEVAGRSYQYDRNGNLLLRNSQTIFDYDQNIFDEENRLIGSSNNGYISRYSYDAFGKRALKSHGETQGVFINGAPAGFVEHKTNFKIEISPYFTATEHEYRKHYFIDQHRILSKIGTGIFQTSLANAPEITAGGIDYKQRIQAFEQSILDYYASLGVPPGPPTLLALLGQPELNQSSLPDATNGNPFNAPPINWPNLAPPDTTGAPGIPIFYEHANLTNENVTAGFNFTEGNITTELEQFYYHYDHSHSTQYVTDFAGAPRQYATYFPSGERWIFQRTSYDSSAYFYNGRTLDIETGFYNMGDVYYDPVTNVEMSLDPVLQNFGQNTFLRRPEGSFYYEYAEKLETDAGFDLEILNSEHPDPFLANAVTNVEIPQKEEKYWYKIQSKGKKRQLEAERKKREQQNKQAVITELNEIATAFQEQDPESASSFFYGDFNSFFKTQQEEKKYKKRKKDLADKRKNKQKKKLRVRFY